MFNITPKIQAEINQYLPLLQTMGRVRIFNKGDVIFRAGDNPDHLLYLTQGIVKSYYLNDGKEVILRLMSQSSAVFSYSSFITGSPSPTQTRQSLEPIRTKQNQTRQSFKEKILLLPTSEPNKTVI